VLEFIVSLSPASIDSLYADFWTCQAVFRSAACALRLADSPLQIASSAGEAVRATDGSFRAAGGRVHNLLLDSPLL
jgi:hypothetical protein